MEDGLGVQEALTETIKRINLIPAAQQINL